MMKRLGLSVGTAIAALALVAGPAIAQTQRGLVNVNVTDVTVQLPIGVAANLCGVNVNVLVSGLVNGPTACQAGSIALAQDQGGGGGNSGANQRGLINVNVSDVTAQVPVSLAANICGVNVNVLVGLLGQGPVDCTAFGRSAAVF